MSRSLLLVLIAVLVESACGASGYSPTGSLTAPGPTTIVGASSDATPIAVGETVSGVVALSDPACDTDIMTDAPDPCQRFAVTPLKSGTLHVQVSSAGPDWLALRVAGLGSYGTTSVVGAATVAAGTTYEVSVALHAPVDGNTSQAFELSTSLSDRVTCDSRASRITDRPCLSR